MAEKVKSRCRPSGCEICLLVTAMLFVAACFALLAVLIILGGRIDEAKKIYCQSWPKDYLTCSFLRNTGKAANISSS